ncbi:MAG: hypothetical protein PHV18_12705 [Lachnospiraceae bacterium]|nr:hypothetical protein [Lachnospiraceae bacterium]
MKARKLVVLTLALGMTAGLTACGGSSSGSAAQTRFHREQILFMAGREDFPALPAYYSGATTPMKL